MEIILSLLKAFFVGGLICIVGQILIDSLLALLTSAKARNVALVASTTVCFFVLLGVIGGIERGLITWGWGVAAAIVIAVIEGVCIKKCK